MKSTKVTAISRLGNEIARPAGLQFIVALICGIAFRGGQLQVPFGYFGCNKRKDSMNTRHRKLFNALWLIVAILISSASAQEANKSKPEQASAVVRVDSGQLQGVEADGVIDLAAMWLLHCKDYPRTAFDVTAACPRVEPEH